MTKPVTLTILGERAPGWNSTLRVHWAKRDELVRAIWFRLCVQAREHEIFMCPVDVHVVATFKGTPLDSDNIAAKLYIDALKGPLLLDDNPKYVRRVTTESKKGKANSVTITLTPVDGAKP